MTWIVGKEQRMVTPNRYHEGYRSERIQPVEVALIHYTAGYSYTGSARWLCNRVKGKDGKPINSKASAHFVIGREGEVLQLASLEDRTWHTRTSRSTWRDRSNVNGMSISFEIANIGFMTEGDGKLLDCYGHTAKITSKPVLIDGLWWEPFPSTQIDTLIDLLRVVRSHFPVICDPTGEPSRICGHSEVDSRKVDPGPLFPWEQVRRAIQY